MFALHNINLSTVVHEFFRYDHLIRLLAGTSLSDHRLLRLLFQAPVFRVDTVLEIILHHFEACQAQPFLGEIFENICSFVDSDPVRDGLVVFRIPSWTRWFVPGSSHSSISQTPLLLHSTTNSRFGSKFLQDLLGSCKGTPTRHRSEEGEAQPDQSNKLQYFFDFENHRWMLFKARHLNYRISHGPLKGQKKAHALSVIGTNEVFFTANPKAGYNEQLLMTDTIYLAIVDKRSKKRDREAQLAEVFSDVENDDPNDGPRKKRKSSLSSSDSRGVPFRSSAPNRI